MKYLCPNCKSERLGKYSGSTTNYSYDNITEYLFSEYLIMDMQQSSQIPMVCLICKHTFPSDKILQVNYDEAPSAMDETTKAHLKYLLQNDKMKAVTYCKNVLGYSLSESVKIIENI